MALNLKYIATNSTLKMSKFVSGVMETIVTMVSLIIPVLFSHSIAKVRCFRNAHS